jgi:mono/diheme cytochrome c family protein
MRRLESSARVRTVQVVFLLFYLLAFVSVLRAGQAGAGAGRTVWDGVFTTEQANRGRTFFSASCAECHGGSLQGGEGKPLSGDQFWSDWRESTVGELLTYISKNMPYSEDGSLAGTLSPSTYVDIVAHMLERNGLPAGAQELTQASSVGVQIIKKDGPGELPASTLARVVGCLAPRGADGSWRLVKATRPERAASGPAAAEIAVPLGDREYQLKFVLTPLDKLVGHRVSVTGLLLGDGGVDGLNVNAVKSVAATCN